MSEIDQTAATQSSPAPIETKTGLIDYNVLVKYVEIVNLFLMLMAAPLKFSARTSSTSMKFNTR